MFDFNDYHFIVQFPIMRLQSTGKIRKREIILLFSLVR